MLALGHNWARMIEGQPHKLALVVRTRELGPVHRKAQMVRLHTVAEVRIVAGLLRIAVEAHIVAEQLHTVEAEVRTRLAPVARRRQALEQVRNFEVLHRLVLGEHIAAEGRPHRQLVGVRRRMVLEPKLRMLIHYHKLVRGLARTQPVEEHSQNRRMGLVEHNRRRRLVQELLHMPEPEERTMGPDCMPELVVYKRVAGWEQRTPRQVDELHALVAGCLTDRLGQANHDEAEERI